MRPLIYTGLGLSALLAYAMNEVGHIGDNANATFDQTHCHLYGVSQVKSLASYHYALLTEGMTKSEVDRLLPVPGREFMSAGGFQTVAYGDGPRIAVTFQNGRLIAKAQNGL